MATPPDRSLSIFAPPVLTRLLAIFLPAALLTGGVVLALYGQDRAKEHALYEQEANHLVELHADLIRRELKAVESDLLYLADQAVLRNYLERAAAGSGPLQDEYLRFCRYRAVYDQIRYLDATGYERVRVNFDGGAPRAVPEGQLQSKATRYYFVQAMLLERGEVFVSPLDLNVEHDRIERPLKPVVRFATPVFDAAGAKRGVLVLNYLGAALIGKLAAVSVGFPGLALLLNRDGHYLHGPAPEDEWGFMLGHGRTFAARHPAEWPALAGAERGQVRTARGLFTLRAVAPRPPLPAHRRAPPAAGADPDAGDASLLVVAHVPPDALDERAAVLLARLLLAGGLFLVLVLVLAWYLAHAAALRRRQERRIAASEARLRVLSTRLITAQEDERRRLSRDLHDELGQVVTAVALDLQRAAGAADARKKDDLIGRALGEARCLLDRIHEISTRVRPTLLDDLGLKDAVRSLLGDYERHAGVVPRARLCFERADVPADVSENAYRILQEALTNVSKHAGVGEVCVDLHVTADGLALAVRDAGAGFVPAEIDGRRLGLLGMRERAELLGGTFAVESAPGRGTAVRVRLPLPAPAAPPAGQGVA